MASYQKVINLGAIAEGEWVRAAARKTAGGRRQVRADSHALCLPLSKRGIISSRVCGNLAVDISKTPLKTVPQRGFAGTVMSQGGSDARL